MKKTHKATFSALRALSANRKVSMVYGTMILTAACLFPGCTTGPTTTKSNPVNPSFNFADLVAPRKLGQNPQYNIVPIPTTTQNRIFINADDNYVVTFVAQSTSGIKTITLSGSGGVACSTGSPSTSFTIPPQTIDLSVQPGGQVFTEGIDPYYFFWAPIEGEPSYNEPVKTFYTRCGAAVPLIGTTTYSGSATSFDGGSTSMQLKVTACPGLSPSPSSTIVACP